MREARFYRRSFADDWLFFKPTTACRKIIVLQAIDPGWMIISGAKHKATDLVRASKCSEHAPVRATCQRPAGHSDGLWGGYQSINDSW